MDPLAAAWDGREFLFAGKDKLFSCDEKGDGLKLLYCTNSQPTALAVVCPGEVVAFVQGSTIKFYYKLEKKVETHITELRGPRGRILHGLKSLEPLGTPGSILPCFAP